MAQDSIRIGKAALEAFTSAIFVKSGLTREHADAWARMLVWANLRGTDSHGIIRIPRYVDLVNAKSINAKPDMRVTRKPGAAAIVLEADRAPSAVALTRAVSEAVAAAREVGGGRQPWQSAQGRRGAGVGLALRLLGDPVLKQALAAPLTAETALAIAAEAARCVEQIRAIDPDHARLDLRRYLQRHVDTLAPNAGRQAVDGVVGQFHRLRGSAKSHRREYRTENLLLRHNRSGLHIA